MIVYVAIGNGIVVPHTLEEYRRLIKGVDMEAAKAMVKEIR